MFAVDGIHILVNYKKIYFVKLVNLLGLNVDSRGAINSRIFFRCGFWCVCGAEDPSSRSTGEGELAFRRLRTIGFILDCVNRFVIIL